MKIETYCLAHQEAKIMPYFMKHYTKFSKVILMEGHSTDKTVEIATDWGAEIRNVDSENTINDQLWLDIKNNCWKDSKADWVIVCDADEFVYHPDLMEYLKMSSEVLYMPRLFNMMSDHYPTTEGQIYDEIQYGKEGGAKMNLFKPSALREINYAIGCHHANPMSYAGAITPCVNSEILTLHMRHLGRKETIEKNRYLYSRLSEVNKKFGWGYHLGASQEEYNRWFNNEMTATIKVI